MKEDRRKYRFNTTDLCNELGVSRFTIIIWEKKGYFTPPRVGTRGDRKFTRQQLDEIVTAFTPGGKRKWHFEAN
jgi:predicted site-specific integrase-resolvase